jgi:hypothetical protein
MESRVRALGLAVAVVLCAALAVGPGRAQEDTLKPSSDREASHANGVDIGDSGKITGAASKRNDSGGGRGGSQSRPPGGDTARAAGSSVRAGPGTDASRNGAAAPAGALGTPSADSAAALRRDVDPVRLEGSLAGLQRRANRKSLIANAPKMPVARSANIGAALPFKRLGTDGGAVRNAIGIVVPGGGQGHAVPDTMGSAGASVRSSGTGIVGADTAIGNIDGANARRPAVSANAITSPVHTSGINGTTMGHIAFGRSYVGGPTNDRAGINGTAVRSRY